MPKYFVVLCSREKTRTFQPVLTWFTSFDSKDAFDNWYTDEIKSRQEIIEEGIPTEEEAQRVCNLSALNLWKNEVDTMAQKDASELDEIIKKLRFQIEIVKLRMADIIQKELENKESTWCTICHKVVPTSAVEHLLECSVDEGEDGVVTPIYFNRICPSCNIPYNFDWSSQWSNAGGSPCRKFYKVKKEADGYYFEKDNEWLSLPEGYLARFEMTEEVIQKLVEQLFFS